MEEVDEIRQEDGPEVSGEPDDLFYRLLSGKTVSETVGTSRGDFTVKFPKQKDIERIGVIVAGRRMGIPAASFDAVTENEIYKSAVLDVMVESGPAWFEKARSRNRVFSWRDMPDGDFVSEVYLKAHSFRQSVQEKLKRPERQASASDDGKGVQAPVDDDVFSGASASVKRT